VFNVTQIARVVSARTLHARMASFTEMSRLVYWAALAGVPLPRLQR
jgi:hypothetical protein